MVNLLLNRFLGKRIFQYLAALTGSLGILSCEMHYGWTSPSLPALINGEHSFKITSTEGSWIIIALLVGTITGALLTGKLSSEIGRKPIILFSSLPILGAWLLIALGPSIEYFYVARTIAGFAVGMSLSVVPIYLGEIAEPALRGLISSLCPVFVVLGILLINLLGNSFTVKQTAFISIILPIILFFTFLWMPESPYYLLMKEKEEKAMKSLEVFLGKEAAEPEFVRLKEELETKDVSKSYRILFTDRVNRKALIIALGLRTIQQLCGTTVITFYCKTIFEETKDVLSPNVSSNIYFTIQFLVAIISSLIVDYTGRRILLFVSISGTGITLLATGLYLHLRSGTLDGISFLPILTLFLYVIFFNIGIRTVPLLMIGEIFGPSIKSEAVSFAAIFFSIVSIITSKFFQMTQDYGGMHISFYTFGILSLLTLVFVYFYIPETKGKTLEEIQTILRGNEENETKRKDLSIFYKDVYI